MKGKESVKLRVERGGRDEDKREHGEGELEKKNASRIKEKRRELIRFLKKLMCRTVA